MTVMRLFYPFFQTSFDVPKILIFSPRNLSFYAQITHAKFHYPWGCVLYTHCKKLSRTPWKIHDFIKIHKTVIKSMKFLERKKTSHGQKTSCLEMSKKNPIYGYRPNSQKTSKITSKMCYIFQEGKRNITFQCVQSCKKVLWKVCVLMYQLQIGSPCWGADEWVVVGQLFLSYLENTQSWSFRPLLFVRQRITSNWM